MDDAERMRASQDKDAVWELVQRLKRGEPPSLDEPTRASLMRVAQEVGFSKEEIAERMASAEGVATLARISRARHLRASRRFGEAHSLVSCALDSEDLAEALRMLAQARARLERILTIEPIAFYRELAAGQLRWLEPLENPTTSPIPDANDEFPHEGWRTIRGLELLILQGKPIPRDERTRELVRQVGRQVGLDPAHVEERLNSEAGTSELIREEATSIRGGRKRLASAIRSEAYGRIADTSDEARDHFEDACAQFESILRSESVAHYRRVAEQQLMEVRSLLAKLGATGARDS